MSGAARDTLPGRILALAEAAPERPSLAFVGADGRVSWQSRVEVLGEATRLAGLFAERGLAPGRAAVVVTAQPRDGARTVLAVLLAGGVPLLVAPPTIQGLRSSLPGILRGALRRSQAVLAVMADELEPEADALGAAGPTLVFARELGEAGEAAGAARIGALAEPAPDDRAVLQLTSGTTGAPRIAVWEQRAVVGAIDAMARAMELGPGDALVSWTPLYHDMGLVNNLLLALVRGLPLALLSPLEVVRRPAVWLRALCTAGATTTWSPNFGYALAAARVRDEELAGVDLGGVRGFWNAAERVHRATLERFHERFRPFGLRREALRTNFGCVETIGGATFGAPGRPPVAERVDGRALREEGVARALDQGEPEARSEEVWVVGCGRAAPGTTVGAYDERGRLLPDGVVGELGLRTPWHLRAYLGEPEETARVLRGDLVFPGDLGYMRGGELFWTGRLRETINLRGKKLDPSELEPVLFAVAGLRKGSFAAFGVEDPEQGTERLVVLAELVPEAVPRAEAIAGDVRRAAALALGLAIDELGFVARGELTKTSSGKRRHLFFRELFVAGRLPLLALCRAGLGSPPASAPARLRPEGSADQCSPRASTAVPTSTREVPGPRS